MSAVIDKDEVRRINRKIETCQSKVDEVVKKTENVIMNVSWEWEKITFTGDSGAVDHVITRDAERHSKLTSLMHRRMV